MTKGNNIAIDLACLTIRDPFSLPNLPDLQESSVHESSVTLDIDQFWKLVSQSQLLSDDQIDAVKSKWPDQDAQQVAKNMVADNVVSDLHSAVLLAGHSGPFFFGRYLITGKIDSAGDDNLWRSFAGRDLRTQHPVKLDFFNGTTKAAVADWKKIQSRVRSLAKCRHDYLLETFQTISLPDYRFVVSELPTGTRLSKKLPPKGRLKLEQAAPVVLQVATAIEAQIAAGKDILVPTAQQLPEHIWLEPKAVVKLQPKWIDDQQTKAQDLSKTLAGLLLRMTGGANADPSNVEKLIEKSGISGDLKNIVQNALKDQSNTDPKSEDGLLATKKFIAALSQVSSKTPKPATSKTVAAFRQVLSDSQMMALPMAEPVKQVPDITADTDSAPLETSNDPRVMAARQAAQMRKSARWKMPAAVATTLFALAVAGAVWALTANQKVISRVIEEKPAEQTLEFSTTPITSRKTKTAPDYSNVGYVQEIVEDDASYLWEAPTTNKAIEFRYVPPTTEILIHARPHELTQAESGSRLLTGISNTFAGPMETFRSSVGVQLQQMATLTLALYPGDSGNYKAIYGVSVTDAVSIEDLKSAWGDVVEVRTKDGKKIFATEDTAFLITSAESDTNVSFVAGEPKLVQEMAMQDGRSLLTRPLQRLADRTDRERHFSFIGSPKSLTDSYGRKLWGDLSNTIVPRLKIFFPDSIQAMGLFLHVDSGEYLEFQFEHSADVSAEELKQQLESKVRIAVNDVGTFASTLPKLDYWDKVRQRMLPMTALLSRDLRWDVEFENVIANTWLPPDAAQNLIAASELTLAFANSVAPSEIADAKQTPKTIEELLASKRSLNIANPPDLNILLTEMANDVNDDFPGMPFQFKITLMGNDLQKEGITQNQRPGPLAFDDMALADILTEIMTSANPDKDITGPADANCKLVWIIVNDEDTENKSVAVTTRAAAASRGDDLPAAFTTP